MPWSKNPAPGNKPRWVNDAPRVRFDIGSLGKLISWYRWALGNFAGNRELAVRYAIHKHEKSWHSGSGGMSMGENAAWRTSDRIDTSPERFLELLSNTLKIRVDFDLLERRTPGFDLFENRCAERRAERVEGDMIVYETLTSLKSSLLSRKAKYCLQAVENWRRIFIAPDCPEFRKLAAPAIILGEFLYYAPYGGYRSDENYLVAPWIEVKGASDLFMFGRFNVALLCGKIAYAPIGNFVTDVKRLLTVPLAINAGLRTDPNCVDRTVVYGDLSVALRTGSSREHFRRNSCWRQAEWRNRLDEICRLSYMDLRELDWEASPAELMRDVAGRLEVMERERREMEVRSYGTRLETPEEIERRRKLKEAHEAIYEADRNGDDLTLPDKKLRCAKYGEYNLVPVTTRITLKRTARALDNCSYRDYCDRALIGEVAFVRALKDRKCVGLGALSFDSDGSLKYEHWLQVAGPDNRSVGKVVMGYFNDYLKKYLTVTAKA